MHVRQLAACVRVRVRLALKMRAKSVCSRPPIIAGGTGAVRVKTIRIIIITTIARRFAVCGVNIAFTFQHRLM